jgi:glycosyltransferase involved in cell wall biosynthesis
VCEVIVVDDGSTDESERIAKEYPVRYLKVGKSKRGPANARNEGAWISRGDILFFLDADCVLHDNAIKKLDLAFTEQPRISAVMGSYDDSPADATFLSQYRNLLHHFTHQHANELASTFWSGCGAIRRDVFIDQGGFDAEKYPRPSIEDIDLGVKLVAAGHTIILRKDIQIKHLKKWTLKSILNTDIFDRAIPWAKLIFSQKNLPNDLNLAKNQRLSAFLTGVLILVWLSSFFSTAFYLIPISIFIGMNLVNSWNWQSGSHAFRREIGNYLWISLFSVAGIFGSWSADQLSLSLLFIWIWVFYTFFYSVYKILKYFIRVGYFILFGLVVATLVFSIIVQPPWWTIVEITLLTLILILNNSFYKFIYRLHGIVFTTAVLPMHCLYFMYSSMTFVFVGFKSFISRRIRYLG